MATAIQFLRSSISSLRPAPPSLSDGMPMVNFNASDPGLYFKLNDQTLMKVGPTQIGDLAPNYNPTGYELLSKGEMWLDTTIDADTKPRPVLKLWDGTQWVAGGGDIADWELPQPPGYILAGPINQPDAPPTFRPLEDSDLPDNISANKLGGYNDGILLIGGVNTGFDEAYLGTGDGSITTSVGENSLTVEVTAGNIAGKGGDGTIGSGDGHVQLNYGGQFTADNRFKFLMDTGTMQAHGPTELGLNPATDTHTIFGDTTISGDVTLTNVYNLTVGGDAFVGHNMTIGSDTTELLDVYNLTEFYSDVFIKDSKTLDIDGFLTVHRDTILGDSETQTLVVNATTTIPAPVTIGRACTQETFTVKSNSVFECDVTILGELNTGGGLVEFPGDVILGSDCSDFVAIKGTQLNTCDIFIGSNVPNPNGEQITLEAATGNITTKGNANITGDLVVSSPLSSELFKVESSTGDATSEGTITAGFFVGDGSQLFNLAVPNSMFFRGDIDATTATAPAAIAGDFYLNTVTGTVTVSWPDIGGQPINQDQFLYFYDNGTPAGAWALGSVQNNQGFVTLNTAQDINGSKTFKAHTQFDETVTVAADKSTLLGGNLTVEKETQLNNTLTVKDSFATVLGGTLQVKQAATFNETLTVDDNKATVLGGTLQVKDAATFNETLSVDADKAATFGGTVTVTDKLTTLFAVKDCGTQALQVNGDSVFECPATFNGGIDMGPSSDLEIGGNLIVHGNTTLGDNLPTACADTLTVNATTTINCPTTVANTFTVSGVFATALGGTLEVTGNTQLNGTLTVAASKATSLGGTLTVAADQATSLGGTLTVAADKATSLGGTLSVASDKATTLGGTLTVSKATLLNDTLTVAASKTTSLGGTLTVLESTTLLSPKDCTATALTVNGLSFFNCLATFNEGITLPSDKDLIVGGDLTVSGSTQLGTACADDTLTITAVTTINCATTINSTLAVKNTSTIRHLRVETHDTYSIGTDTARFKNLFLSGAMKSATIAASSNATIGGTLGVTGNVSVNTNKFTVTASNGNTAIAGTLGVTGATTLNNTLAVKNTSTIRHLYVETHNTYNIGQDGTRFKNLYLQGLAKIGSTLAVDGKVTFTSNAADALVITGKARSASTASTDDGTTLVTKNYLTSGAGSGTGQFGYWSRTGTTVSLANSGDAVSLSGTLEVTGATTLNSTLAVKNTSTIRHLRVETHNTYSIGTDTARFKNFYLSNLAKIGGALDVTGASTLRSTLLVKGITTVEANIVPSADGGASLGTSTARFANLYTQDMHFSNEGTKGNDVDGTTGDWTLQEGNDHIYFINNKTGAKFRVVMESVG